MTTRSSASTSRASAVRLRSCHESPRPVETTTPSREASHPPSIAPTSPADGPTRGRSSRRGASVRSRARRMTKSASMTSGRVGGGARGVSRARAETAVSRPPIAAQQEQARFERATLPALLSPRPRRSLEEVRFDHSTALEFLELERIGRHLKSGIEWKQADQLSTEDADPCIVGAALDFAPDGGERGLRRVEEIHRHLRARWIGELESEGLHRGQSAG